MATRRTLIQLIGAGIVAPRMLFAQSARKALVVVLFPGDSENDERVAQPFFDEMQRLGWTEGASITYERLSGRGAREYVYLLKVVNPGVFKVSPGKVEPMYQPNIFATSDPLTMEVK